MINADSFTPVADANSIPTGEIRPVKDSPMDFTMHRHPIGDRIDAACDQLKFGNAGYDHNWALNKAGEGSRHWPHGPLNPSSGRVMEVLTTEPGVQFYSAPTSSMVLPAKDGAVVSPPVRRSVWRPSTTPIRPISPSFRQRNSALVRTYGTTTIL